MQMQQQDRICLVAHSDGCAGDNRDYVDDYLADEDIAMVLVVVASTKTRIGMMRIMMLLVLMMIRRQKWWRYGKDDDDNGDNRGGGGGGDGEGEDLEEGLIDLFDDGVEAEEVAIEVYQHMNCQRRCYACLPVCGEQRPRRAGAGIFLSSSSSSSSRRRRTRVRRKGAHTVAQAFVGPEVPEGSKSGGLPHVADLLAGLTVERLQVDLLYRWRLLIIHKHLRASSPGAQMREQNSLHVKNWLKAAAAERCPHCLGVFNNSVSSRYCIVTIVALTDSHNVKSD